MLIGVIADDLTGATDVAVNIAREGLSVVQMNGLPEAGQAAPEADVVVIALKSRTIPAQAAVEQSLAAARWLKDHGAERLYFKYCSTFDSTPEGNIGPVTEALLDFLQAKIAFATPAYPRNLRTVYQGHLFVGNGLLSESSMKDHPLTPMRDANLLRVLASQSKGTVGLIPWEAIDQGTAAIQAQVDRLTSEGYRHAIVDATSDHHLVTAAHALLDQALTTGGSGLAMGLAVALAAQAQGSALNKQVSSTGPAVLFAGSCSQATLQQIEVVKQHFPTHRLDPMSLAAGPEALDTAFSWAQQHLGKTPFMVYASASPESVLEAQQLLGRERSAEIVESAFKTLAVKLAAAGAKTFVVGGGETSGAVIEALGVKGLAIGPEIAPGVPWTIAVGGEPYRIALKSGNFGQPDFFVRALDMLQ